MIQNVAILGLHFLNSVIFQRKTINMRKKNRNIFFKQKVKIKYNESKYSAIDGFHVLELNKKFLHLKNLHSLA